jgi:hypothetical protein
MPPRLSVDVPMVQIRGNTATVTVLCERRETHHVRVRLDGVVSTFSTPHESDVDDVVAALGGALHGCARVKASMEAAFVMWQARMGVHDVPHSRFFQYRGWQNNVTCDHCVSSGQAMSHLVDPVHLAQMYGGYESVVQRFGQWVARMNGDETAMASFTDNYRSMAAARVMDRMDRRRGVSSWLRRVPNGVLLTPAFVTAAGNLVGNDGSKIVDLRVNGLRVEWVKRVSALVTPEAARYARLKNPTFGKSLYLARNASSAQTARYINAGIHTHFHTYAKLRVEPDDVIAVWKGSRGEASLADLLNAGVTIPEALHRYAR